MPWRGHATVTRLDRDSAPSSCASRLGPPIIVTLQHVDGAPHEIAVVSGGSVPAASSTPIGPPCPGTPNLIANSPVLGATLSLAMTSLAPGTEGAFVFGTEAVTPVPVGSVCPVYLDLGGPSGMIPFWTISSSAIATVPLPS